MTDAEELRAALAAGPHAGNWTTGNTDPLLFGVKQGAGTEPLGFVYGPSHAENSEHGRRCLATAAYIAAASPDRIARLLDALEAAQREAKSWEQQASDRLDDALLFARERDAARAVLARISELDPTIHSEEGHNEWGEADCFSQARKLAREAMKAAHD